jgi:Cu(I)/Ag(I) efflux system membrane protein CusA/SilA
MKWQGLNANIMSLGGIAIAIGAMIDAAIVMIENAHKQIEVTGGRQDHWTTITIAAKQVGPALFFSLLIITFSFIPIFTLQAQEGRLFSPLAFTKTYAMAASALLAVTLVPVLMGYFIRETMLPDAWGSKKQKTVTLIATGGTVVLVFLLTKFATAYTVLYSFGIVFSLSLGALVFLLCWPQAITEEEKNPLNRLLIWLYRPVISWALRHKILTIVIAALMASTIIPYQSLVVNKMPDGLFRTAAQKLDFLFPLDKIGGEFMPPLNEGDLLYMPTTLPGISITKARELLQQTDKIIKSFPEVESVFGKIGRADTATDPAPLAMIETTIRLRPESDWRTVPVKRFFSEWPLFVRKPLSIIWPEEKTISQKQLTDELNKAIQFPGLTNAWTMPIKTRIDMLATGIKTPVGIKLMGDNLSTLSGLGKEIEAMLRPLPGTLSVFSERVTGGYYFDYEINRKAASRYGLTIGDVQDVIMTAIGGMKVSETIEGLERYPVNVRYSRELRDSVSKLKRVLIPTPMGAQIPITQVADINIRRGPPVIKSENSRMSAWIYIDLDNIDVATYVKNARKVVDENISLPPGYSIVWSGQYEYMERANKRLAVVVPITLLIIFILLYFNFKNISESVIVMLTLPFAIAGGIWFIYLLGYNMSIAVGVGFIALAGVAAEIGVLVLIYIDNSYEKQRIEGKMNNKDDLYAAFIEGTSKRVRPIMMTVTAIIAGLLPLFWGHGAGADTMRRIAAPMIGGMVSSTILTLVVIPAIYALWKGREFKTPPERG